MDTECEGVHAIGFYLLVNEVPTPNELVLMMLPYLQYLMQLITQYFSTQHYFSGNYSFLFNVVYSFSASFVEHAQTFDFWMLEFSVFVP